MKGITHFLCGVMIASFFPLAVEASLTEKSLIIILGGLFGLLADPIDFRSARYLWKINYEIMLDDKDPDPRIVADIVSNAINEAYDKKKMVTVKFHTLKISANYYRTYSVIIDEVKKMVICEIGPLKTLGQAMGKGHHPWSKINKRAVAFFKPDVINTYFRKTDVQIFSGPDLAFVPEGNHIRIDFIAWHRRWSHSFTMGAAFAPIGMLLFADWNSLFNGRVDLFFSPLSITAFFISMFAYWGHVVVDQMGYLGSNLFYPFTTKRKPGLGWTSSGGVIENFFTNYICTFMIIWNLNAYAPKPAFTMPLGELVGGNFSDPVYYALSLINYVLLYIVLPLGIIYGIVLYLRKMEKVTTDTAMEEGVDISGEFGSIGEQ